MIRVLHIDDEAPIRLLGRVNLEAAGMEVIEAADAWTGVQLAKRERPNLILLNVNLPPGVGSPDPAWTDPGNAGGWRVAEELLKHQETREIPVVFLTGRAAARDLTRGFGLGAVDYITKPFNPAELPERLRGVVERVERGERDELRREKLSELSALTGAE